jgi:glycosyltransferase involved in cell wall biosynthesis
VTLVFNCRFLHHFYAPLFQGYSNQVVIYNGVDTRLFHPAAAAPPSAARFAFLGRADWDKGFLDFCRAMASLPRPLIGGIEIIGEGRELREGLELLRASGRSDLVRQAGPSDHETVPERLRTASVLVHPSRDEGMPTAVFEAMACGLAVVATTAGGTPEVVRHGETGLCVAPGDFAGLMAACRLLAENAELRRGLGANARALVASHYDASASLAAMKHVIEETIDRTGDVGQSP